MNGLWGCADPAALWVNGINEPVAANTIKDRQVVCPLVCALLRAHTHTHTIWSTVWMHCADSGRSSDLVCVRACARVYVLTEAA